MPKETRPVLPVIMRFTKEWGVTAYFPAVGDMGQLVTCYAHVGQHSAADPSCMREGTRATPEQYADLLAELEGIYSRPGDPDAVTLRVMKRRPPHG